VRTFRPEIWGQKNWLLHHDNAPSFFTRKFLIKNNAAVVPHLPYFSLLPRLQMKLKAHHFGTTEVIEAESRAVLNTHREHDFQGALKQWQWRWERCILEEGDYFDGGQ
jgi:hypothetical protein